MPMRKTESCYLLPTVLVVLVLPSRTPVVDMVDVPKMTAVMSKAKQVGMWRSGWDWSLQLMPA